VALADPLQLFLVGHGSARTEPLSGLQKPAFRSALATTTPARSHTNPTGHFVQTGSVSAAPAPPPSSSRSRPRLSKNPISHTHVVLPSPRVVIFVGQDAHTERFDSRWYLPWPQSVHCAYPSSLYVPGGHKPEHCGVVAPEVLLYVPPLQISHPSNDFVPSTAPHRPAGHKLHCLYPSSLYVPGGQRPEHCFVFAPDVLLYVPPRQIVHASNDVAPCVAPHRPAGQRLWCSRRRTR